jgi:TonB family protein
MFRDITLSFIGHSIVLGGVVVASFFGGKKEIQTFDIYQVKAVSSQSISNLLNRAEDFSKPIPNVPQIKTDEEKALPQKFKKKTQTVKGSSRSNTALTKSQSKSSGNGSGSDGIRTDNEFEYPDYLMELRDLIEQKWRPPTPKGTLKTTVFFKIDKTGKVVRIFIEKPTGNISFDSSAYNAVTECNPFPPLPEGYKNDNLGVHFDFIYQVD